MIRTLDAQALGPILVFGAFAASDTAMRLLEAYPSSALAWYLNFDLFYTFETARLQHSPLGPFFGPHGLLVSCIVIATVVLAQVAKARFVLAFLSNLSFAVVIALMHCRFCDPAKRSGAVWWSLWEDRQAEAALGLLLLGAAFAAFVASHLHFIAAVMRERGERRKGALGYSFEVGHGLPIPATC